MTSNTAASESTASSPASSTASSRSSPAPLPPHPHWPPSVAPRVSIPETSLVVNLETSARRYPDKTCIAFFDRRISYRDALNEVEAIAGWLQKVAGVRKGDRVLLFMHNSPQFIVGYYAILRADAVVVPVNPMNLTDELKHCAVDSGAKVVIAPQVLFKVLQPLLGPAASGAPLQRALIAAYSDGLPMQKGDDGVVHSGPFVVPDFVAMPRMPIPHPMVTTWADALAAAQQPDAHTAGPADLAVLPYTSGTTGLPKACMHTHRTTMSTIAGQIAWFGSQVDNVALAVLPPFHVTGMQGGMNIPIMAGMTIVVMPRWDKDLAGQLIQHYRVSTWGAISTMMVDFIANPKLGEYDLSSIRRISGGGAAMPEAIAKKLNAMGLNYNEGYGMSETMAPTHVNPMHRPKAQCLGIPFVNTEARLIDPDTLKPVARGEVGEVVVHGPQVMLGYWNHPEADAESFITLEGKRFLRTGDLAREDEEGYWFMVDRLKRMINAAGFKVWPAEVEAMMYAHPAIREACIISIRDARKGEAVKAIVSLKAPATAEEIVSWCHDHMAAYKVPHVIEFAESLPKSAAGKIMWRQLQEKENAQGA